jgi:polar amino acid transport system substrate-binding protein
MKQVVQNYRTGELKVDELPPPALKPGGVLVRTSCSLISAGTEKTIVETAQSSLVGKARSRPDLVRQVFDSFKREGVSSTYEKVKAKLNQSKALGYSASGVVTAVGRDADEFRVGDRVACAGGGYASHAEFIFVPRNLCCKVPDGVTDEAACYTTVGAIAMQGIRQADPRLGEGVAVIGLGLVGQLTVQLLKAAGCQVLGFDIDPAACELALKSGADSVSSNFSSARASCDVFTNGRGADCILITAATKSSQPIELAAELARDRARIVVVGSIGMDVPRHSFYAKELELKLSRSYGPGRYDPEYEEKGSDYPIGYVRWTEKRNMESFLRLIAEGKVNTALLTTHRFTVANATKAYDLILNGGERFCGVVLEYPTADEKTPSPQQRETSAKPAPTDQIGIGFIGAGNFARGVLLPATKRSLPAGDFRLVGVCAATGLSAKGTADQFGFSYSTTDHQEVLGDENSQIVFIATRHDSHASLAAEALRRGKHVFVEKPLAINEEDLQEVVSAALESGVLLMVGFNRRFAALATDIKARFGNRTGPMSIIYRVNAGQLPPEHWAHDAAEGGGRIIGEACHFIDFIQYLTDSLPAQVSAASVAGSNSSGFIDDSAVITLSMTDGSIGTIIYTASGDPTVAKEHVEIFCDRSVGSIDDFRRGTFVCNRKTVRLGRGLQDKGHAAEVAAFFAAVQQGNSAPIELESVTATTVASFAAVESIRTNASIAIDLKRFGI